MEARGRVGQVRGALALEVRDEHDAARAGLGREREVGEPVVVDAEERGDRASSTRAALSVAMSGRQSPPASAKPATVPRGVGDGCVGDGENRAARADRHHDVAGRGAEPERGAGVVARARTDQHAGRCASGRLRRAEHARQHDRRASEPVVAGRTASGAPEGALEQVEVVRTGRRAPVRRAARVGAVGGQRVEVGAERALVRRAVAAQPPGQPVVGEGDGGDPGRVRRLGVAQPAQLGRRERGDGHDADAARVLGAPTSSIRSSAACALRVSFQSRASRMTWPCGVEHDHAVLLSGDRDRGDVVEAAGLGDRGLQRIPPRTRGRPRCRPGARRARSARAAPVSRSRTTTLQLWVDESTPATSVIALPP